MFVFQGFLQISVSWKEMNKNSVKLWKKWFMKNSQEDIFITNSQCYYFINQTI